MKSSKNWKTTLFGLLAALFGAATMYLPQFSAISTPLALAATAAMGMVSKDGDVTGGTTAQTPEAQTRITQPTNAPSGK